MQNEERQPNEVTFKFAADDLRKLLDTEPDYVLIKTGIEPRTIDNEQVGVVVIRAEAYKEGQRFLLHAKGCPVPPCTAP